MATEVHQFTATVPASTQVAALYVATFDLDNRVVESIDIEVPPGPVGLMGFYLARSGTQIIPLEQGEYIVWDDRFDTWYLSDYPTAQGWELHGYNLDDAYDHDVIVRFHTNPTVIQPSPTPVVNIMSQSALSNPVVLA